MSNTPYRKYKSREVEGIWNKVSINSCRDDFSFQKQKAIKRISIAQRSMTGWSFLSGGGGGGRLIK